MKKLQRLLLAGIIESRNLEDAKQLAIDDDEMDKLQRKLIQTLVDMAMLVKKATADATTALLTEDLSLA